LAESGFDPPSLSMDSMASIDAARRRSCDGSSRVYGHMSRPCRGSAIARPD
jgi:hypothetical protein